MTADAAGHVSNWGDRTGKATMTFPLPPPSGVPTVDPVGIRGHKAIRLDSSPRARGKGTLSAAIDTRPVAFFLVGQTIASTSLERILWTSLPSGVFEIEKTKNDTIQVWSVLGGTLNFVPTGNVTNVSAMPHVFCVRRKGAQIEIRVDGSATSTTDPNGVVNVLGKDVYFELPIMGDALVYDADLTPADVTSVESYLKTKYSL